MHEFICENMLYVLKAIYQSSYCSLEVFDLSKQSICMFVVYLHAEISLFNIQRGNTQTVSLLPW